MWLSDSWCGKWRERCGNLGRCEVNDMMTRLVECRVALGDIREVAVVVVEVVNGQGKGEVVNEKRV